MNGQNTGPAYLDFAYLNDYLDHLTALGVASTHLECKSRTGQPEAEFHITAVNFYAAASAFIDNHIACCAIYLGGTHSVRLQQDLHLPPEERFYTGIKSQFADVVGDIASKGFEILPGVWSHEMPFYLRG